MRILISGLSFFGAALVLAAFPVFAQGSSKTSGVKPCTIVGTSESEGLLGTSGADVICGLGGADTIFAGGGKDVVRGGKGADRIQGGSGGDVLRGSFGRDLFFAYDGTRDRVNGGPGNDTLSSYDPGVDVLRSMESS